MDETSMIKGKGRSDNRMYALSFATVLLLKYLKINGTQAGEILEKDDSSICRFKKNIRSLKSNLVKEKELMDKMSIMELEVEAYIDMLNQHKYKNLVNEQQSSKVK